MIANLHITQIATKKWYWVIKAHKFIISSRYRQNYASRNGANYAAVTLAKKLNIKLEKIYEYPLKVVIVKEVN